MRKILLFLTLLLSQLIARCQVDQLVRFNSNQSLTVQELLDRLVFEEVPLIFSPTTLPSNTLEITRGEYTVSELLNRLKIYSIRYQLSNDAILLSIDRTRPVNRNISGFVRDAETGEALIGATIKINDGKHGVITNSYGFYSITFRPGQHRLTISFLGYPDLVDTVSLVKNIKKNYSIKSQPTELDELVIEYSDGYYNINSLIPGEKFLDYQQKGQVPYFLGEVDVLQKSLLLPGIRTLGEDASGINVRGGDIDQNLLLLDEAVIYNPNHFYGLISVFNPEAINRVKIMKGFIPPTYGGRASSVITVHQKDGNRNKFGVSGGVGLVSARLMIEGPMKKGKNSFLLSGRQSLYDLSLDGLNNNILRRSGTSFQDVNMKLNWDLGRRNSLFVSGYLGSDRNRTGFDAIRRWGNRTLSVRWNHSFGKRLFSNYSLIFSDYTYRITDPVEAGSFIGKSNIIDYSLKLNHQFFQNVHSKFDFGSDFIFHRLKPGDRIPFDENSSSTNPLFLDIEHGLEWGLYASHEFDFNHKLKALYGIRYSGQLFFGPGDIFIYDDSMSRSPNSIIDTLKFKPKEVIDSFHGLEPRISINWRFTNAKSIKMSYNRINQYVHLISNTASPAPTDIWKLSNRYVEPIKTNHYSLGLYQNFSENMWETSLEVYYKDMKNLLEYKDDADLFFNAHPETELISGEGRAYGVEYYMERTKGLLKGWFSYTLSRSERKANGEFPEEVINDGKYYPDDHDKTHDISLVGIYEFSDRLSFSASFNYSSGRPLTFPTGKYEINGTIVPYFEGRNQNRLTDYHRLDISAKWSPERKKERKLNLSNSYWTFTLYNVYARRNAYSYFFRQSETNPELTEVIRYSIFGTIIPAVTYNFKF